MEAYFALWLLLLLAVDGTCCSSFPFCAICFRSARCTSFFHTFQGTIGYLASAAAVPIGGTTKKITQINAKMRTTFTPGLSSVVAAMKLTRTLRSLVMDGVGWLPSRARQRETRTQIGDLSLSHLVTFWFVHFSRLFTVHRSAKEDVNRHRLQ